MSKIKIFNYSNEKYLTKLQFENDQHELEDIKRPEDFDSLDIENVLNKNYDIIEIAANDYDLFKPYLTAIDWKVNLVGMADLLLKQPKGYRPFNLMTATLLKIIKQNSIRINSQLPVIVVGDMHFVINVVTQLALNGFVQIIYSLSEEEDSLVELVEKKIRSFIFNIDLKFVHINEMTTSEISGSLFISDFRKSANKEAYELLTYFNFLSQGALFIDFNSIEEGSLVEDARKAEITVVDEVEFIKQKYIVLKDIFKI